MGYRTSKFENKYENVPFFFPFFFFVLVGEIISDRISLIRGTLSRGEGRDGTLPRVLDFATSLPNDAFVVGTVDYFFFEGERGKGETKGEDGAEGGKKENEVG